MAKIIMGREPTGLTPILEKAGEELLAGKLATTVGNHVVYKSGPTTDLGITGDGGTSDTLQYVLKLDDTRVMLAWRYYSGSAYTLRIVVVSNILSDTQTEGTYFDVASNATLDYLYCVMTLVAPNKVLLCYRRATDTNGNIRLYGITDTDTITLLDNDTFGTAESPADISIIAVDTDKALITYSASSSTKKVFISTTINNNIINYASGAFGGADVYFHPSMLLLETNKVFFAYSNRGNSEYGTALIFTVSGTTASQGTAVVFESAITSQISCTILETNKVLIAYRDEGNSNYGTACTATISGTTITPGTPQVIESGGNTIAISVVKTSSIKAFITFLIGTNLYKNFLNISGSTITPETKQLITTLVNNAITIQPSEARNAMAYIVSNLNIFVKLFDSLTGNTPTDIGYKGYTTSDSNVDYDGVLKVGYVSFE